MYALLLLLLGWSAPLGAAVHVNGGGDVNRVKVPQQSHWRPDGTWLAPVVGADLPTPPLPPVVQALSTQVLVEGFDVKGVTLVSASTLQPLLAPLVGQRVTAGRLQQLVQQLTAQYVAAGYPTVQVKLADQALDVRGSVVQVLVHERPDVHLVATGPARESAAVGRAIEKLQTVGGPLTTRNIEQAVAPLRALPGMRARAELALAENNAPELRLHTARPKWEGEVAISNHGSRFLGPNQLEGRLVRNGVASLLADRPVDIFDQLELQGVQATNAQELSYGTADYRVAVGPWDTLLEVGVAAGATNPGWTLAPLDLEGKSRAWHVAATQPWLDGPDLTWASRVSFDRLKATNSVTSAPLSDDTASTLRLGNTLTTQGPWHRGNYMVEVAKGLDVLDATPAGTRTASRTRGTATEFSKLLAEGEHLQRLNENWRVLLGVRGQYSTHALLAGEELGFGGAGWGRGYTNQELLGDHGVLGKAELQLAFRPGLAWLPAYQLFGFYDFGAVWNKDRDAGEPDGPETRLSGGLGTRIDLSDTLRGELVLAKPLSHKPLTQGDGNVSVLFRLGKSFEGGAL